MGWLVIGYSWCMLDADRVVAGYRALSRAARVEQLYESLLTGLQQQIEQLERECGCGCMERLRTWLDAQRALEAMQSDEFRTVYPLHWSDGL